MPLSLFLNNMTTVIMTVIVRLRNKSYLFHNIKNCDKNGAMLSIKRMYIALTIYIGKEHYLLK